MGSAAAPQAMDIGVMDGMMKMAQVELMKAQSADLDSQKNKRDGLDSDLTKEMTTKVGQETSKLIEETTNEQKKGVLLDLQAEQTKSQTNLLDLQGVKVTAETGLIYSQTGLTDELRNKAVAEQQAIWKSLEETALRMVGLSFDNELKAGTIEASTRLVIETAAQAAMNVQLLKAKKELTEEQTDKIFHDVVQGYIKAGGDLLGGLAKLPQTIAKKIGF